MKNRTLQRTASRFALILPVVLLLTASFASAIDDDAGHAGAILRHGTSARAYGLGETGAALVGDPAGLLINPASMMWADTPVGIDVMGIGGRQTGGYDVFSITWSRPTANRDGLAGFLFGPQSSWGFSFMNLGVDGLEYRSDANDLLPGSLEYSDQALVFAYAREFIHTQGVLDLGLSVKFLHQGLTGGDFDDSVTARAWDFGLQFRPINPTLLSKLLPLRRTLPLRLGLVFRNYNSPEVGLVTQEDVVPSLLRYGLAYDFADVGKPGARLTFGLDRESLRTSFQDDSGADVDGASAWYSGLEYAVPFGAFSTVWRAGMNTRGEGVRGAFGAGFGYDRGGWNLAMELGQGTVRDIDDERRVALVLRWRGGRGDDFIGGTEFGGSDRNRYLGALVAQDGEGARTAAIQLTDTYDTGHSDRYDEFIGGFRRAMRRYEAMVEAARDPSQPIEQVAGIAEQAAEQFTRAAEGAEDTSFSQRIAWAEAEIHSGDLIAAATVLEAAVPSGSQVIELDYMRGVVAYVEKDWTAARDAFQRAASAGGDTQRDMKATATLGWAQALAKLQDYEGAIAKARDICRNESRDLRHQRSTVHPGHADRMLAFPDRRLADDALLVIAEALNAQGKRSESAAEAARLLRLYSAYDAADAGYALIEKILTKQD